MRPTHAVLVASIVSLGSCVTPGPPVEAAPNSVAPQDPAPRNPAEADHAAQGPSSHDDGFDWIKLNSGEWLKGELVALRDGTLTFDSDELDELELDWTDVAELYSAAAQTIMVTDRITHTGRLTIRGDEIILAGEPERRFQRRALMSIIPGKPAESNYWSGSASLGVTARSGNTDQSDSTAYLFLRRESPATRWDTTYNGALSKVGGTETANSHNLRSKFDAFLTRRLYVTAASLRFFRDPFQNIASRLTPGVGLGYDIIDTHRTDLDVTAGAGYQYTRFDSVTAGMPEIDEVAVVIFGAVFEWDPTDDIEIKLDYSANIGVQDAANTNHHFQAVLSVDLIGSLDLDVGFIWDRVGQPALDADGNRPQQDDYRFTLGFGFDF